MHPNSIHIKVLPSGELLARWWVQWCDGMLGCGDRWDGIAQVLGKASRVLQQPSGSVQLTNLGRAQSHTLEPVVGDSEPTTTSGRPELGICSLGSIPNEPIDPKPPPIDPELLSYTQGFVSTRLASGVAPEELLAQFNLPGTCHWAACTVTVLPQRGSATVPHVPQLKSSISHKRHSRDSSRSGSFLPATPQISSSC